MPAETTQALAQFAASLTYDDIPASAREQTKNLLLDTLACALAGHQGEETGQVEALFGDPGFIEVKEGVGLRAEEFRDVHFSIQFSVFSLQIGGAGAFAGFNEPAGLGFLTLPTFFREFNFVLSRVPEYAATINGLIGTVNAELQRLLKPVIGSRAATIANSVSRAGDSVVARFDHVGSPEATSRTSTSFSNMSG